MNNLQKKINEIFQNENIEVLDYSIMKNPATVKCLNCGNVYTLQKAENFIRKGKKCICTNCINNGSGGRLTLQDFQDRINKKYPNENLKVIKYSLNNKPATIKCLKCGNNYTLQNAGSFLSQDKKRLCSHCYPNKREAMNNSINNFLNFISNNKDFCLFENLLVLLKHYY